MPLFLLKGGVYLERRLPAGSRATKDVDTLFRGSLSEFTDALDLTLAQPCGPIALTRTEIATIDAPRQVKPRRFDVLLAIRGITWRRIQVEVAFGDGRIGERAERMPAPQAGFFGIATPPELVGIAMDYQVAQKLHACTDPHELPDMQNDRVRDIVDLNLIRDIFYPPAHPSEASARQPRRSSRYVPPKQSSLAALRVSGHQWSRRTHCGETPTPRPHRKQAWRYHSTTRSTSSTTGSTRLATPDTLDVYPRCHGVRALMWP